jgi:hypothetical protein
MKTTLNRRLTSLSASFALLTALAAAPAHATLVHKYTFSSNANDSVGTAHGTVVDPGVPTAVYTAGGQLDLSANTGQGSGGAGPTEDAYVDLPNLIIENAANSGTSGAVSLEYWFTVSTHRTWQWIGGFAGPLSGGGSEGVTNNGAVSYMLVTPSSGRRNQGIEISNNSGGLGENTLGLSAAAMPALPPLVQHHVVGVWDKNDTSGGTNPGGTMHLYLNGVEVLPGAPFVGTTNAIRPDFNLNDLNDEDNWLGRSQWPDPVFDGLFNEFRIYDHPLSSAEVAASFAIGPDPIPEPTTGLLMTIGVAAGMLRRRRRA